MLSVVLETKCKNATRVLNYIVQYNSRMFACTIEMWGIIALIVLRIKDSWYPATSIFVK